MNEDVDSLLLGVSVVLTAAGWVLIVAWLVWRIRSKDTRHENLATHLGQDNTQRVPQAPNADPGKDSARASRKPLEERRGPNP